MYLALLCKSHDVKTCGYHKIFEPLLQDLVTLEQQGVFVSQLGIFVKGTLECVVSDNLAAHGIAGFVESFWGQYFCRFCTAERAETQVKEVRSGAFTPRNKELHQVHINTAQSKGGSFFGVKKVCIFTERLAPFCVTSGYPPDVVHDLFEGIVPVELALCFGVLISKNLFTLEDLNKHIKNFQYKWDDKKNRPHLVPHNFARHKTIGGNAHENWCLLRLLPFMIGELIPEDEPAWKVILDLKDITELVVAPVHCEESVAYLECKISACEVTHVSTIPVDVMKEDIALHLTQKHPDLTTVTLAQSVSSNGIEYGNGMIIVHGSVSGLPAFAEVLQMCILENTLIFICRK